MDIPQWRKVSNTFQANDFSVSDIWGRDMARDLQDKAQRLAIKRVGGVAWGIIFQLEEGQPKVLAR